MSANGAQLRADAAERLFPAEGPATPPGGSRALALAVALVLHAGLMALLLAEVRLAAPRASPPEPIPVEIVVEPPPPAPETPAKPVETPPLVEKEATDAPRSANSEKTERDAPDATSSAPPAPLKPEPPQAAPTPAPEAAPEAPRNDAAATPEAASESLPQAPEGEAPKTPDDKPQSKPAPPAAAESKPAPQRLAAFVGLPFPKWERGQKAAALEPLPDIKLGAASGPTPVTGGKAKATYLSILYGLIIGKLRKPGPGAQAPEMEGIVDFVIDGEGRLVQRRVVRSSGSADLDAAAFEAVAAASPYPAPPTGGAVSLKFTYGPK